MKHLLTIASFAILAVMLLPTALATTNVNTCQTLSTMGEYYILTANLTTPDSKCFLFSADNITLDGNGNFITQSAGGPQGIVRVENRNNITIKNLEVNGTGGSPTGIYSYYSNTTTIFNVTETTGLVYGIYLEGSGFNGNISGNIINASNFGLYFQPNSGNISGWNVSYNYINQNDTQVSDFDIYFLTNAVYNSASRNAIYNNLLNTSQFVGYSNYIYANETNWNNSMFGNYWGFNNHTGFSDTCVDLDVNGICDNSFSFFKGTPDKTDFLPKSTYSFSLPVPPTLSSGANITGMNAWNSSAIMVFSMFSTNGTWSMTNTTATGYIFLSSSYAPTGNVSFTIYKSGYINYTTGNISVNDSMIDNATAYLVHQSDVVHITSPTNTTYFSNPSLIILTPPPLGNIFSIKYNLDGTNTSANTSSSSYNTTITPSKSHHYLVAYARNDTFGGEFNASVNFSVSYSQYNINLYDEMTGYWFSMAGKNVSLQVACPDYSNLTQLTSPSTQNFTMSCSNPLVSVFVNDTSMWGITNQFRSQIPTSGTGNMSFFLINTSNNRPVYYTIHIADYLGSWAGAAMNVTKSIPDFGNEIIASQRLDTAGNVNTYLIDGQKYTITLISSDGTQIRTTGDLLVSYLTTTTAISLLNLPFVPQHKNVPQYQFTCDLASTTVGIIYYDLTNYTSQIALDVTDVVNGTSLYSTSVAFNGTTYAISWNGVPINKSVMLKMTAYGTQFGTIMSSQVCYFSPAGRAVELGIPDAWYVPIAVFLIILVALIFSAYNATIGGVITLFFSGMLWYIGWLPSVYEAVLFLGVIIIIFARMRTAERQGGR